MVLQGAITILCGLAAAGAPIDFDTQVMPVFTKSGCNAGACHGAALGQGGFKLSLLGQSAEEDYQAVVQELEGRRVNLADPAHSLLLAKPTEQLNHGGGTRLDAAGEALVHQWLASGAPRLQTRRLVKWDVQPRSALLNAPDDEFRLRITARFDNGTSEDVTTWTVITPSDPAALSVEADGRIAARRRGVHSLVLRYLDRVAALQVIVPLGERPVDFASQARESLIDQEVLALLESLRIEPAPPADDAAFLRRARLDLTGRLPQVEEVRAFLSDKQLDKRARLIKRLLSSPDFVDFWSHKWSRWLRIDSNRMDSAGALALYSWLREQIAGNEPLDKLAARLIDAEGDSHHIGPANFTRATAGAREQAEHVSQLFLGARLGCANCHNHPLDRWTQDDYHGLAALFARLERGREVRMAARGEVTHPRTGEPALPRLPGVEFLPGDEQGRQRLAAWMTAKENPHFARAWVNRLWREMFGRGLVEPADDLRETNPASHPQLLSRLSADFAASGFDMRRLLRQIGTSSAYARGGPTANALAATDLYYACLPGRALEPEVLADALCDVTGVPEKYLLREDADKLPPGTRAVQLYDVRGTSAALTILGRCSRPELCDTGAAPATLAAKLHQINGPLVNAKLVSPQGNLHGLLEANGSDDAMLEEFYLRALSRLPTPSEREHWLRILRNAPDEAERRERWEDFVWGLLNCREFTTNH